MGTIVFFLGLISTIAVGVNKLIAISNHVKAPMVTESPYFLFGPYCNDYWHLAFPYRFCGRTGYQEFLRKEFLPY